MTNPYLLHGEELARAEAQRKSGGRMIKPATPMTMREKVREQHASGELAKPMCVSACYCTNGTQLLSERARLIEALKNLLSIEAIQPRNDSRYGNAFASARSLLRELGEGE